MCTWSTWGKAGSARHLLTSLLIAPEVTWPMGPMVSWVSYLVQPMTGLIGGPVRWNLQCLSTTVSTSTPRVRKPIAKDAQHLWSFMCVRLANPMIMRTGIFQRGSKKDWKGHTHVCTYMRVILPRSDQEANKNNIGYMEFSLLQKTNSW